MRKILVFILFGFFYLNNCAAQETVKKSNRLTDSVVEKFNVLKSDKKTKHGLYQALYNNVAIASGQYQNGKKAGTWHFYDPEGKLLENYDFDHDKFLYEAREDTTSPLRYTVDKVLTDSDKVAKPLRPGGRFYGYIPFVNAFKVPFNRLGINDTFVNFMVEHNSINATIELLISPGGRLAGYKVHLVATQYQINENFKIDADLFEEEDRKFTPATLNGEPISCRIFITCYVNYNGKLVF